MMRFPAFIAAAMVAVSAAAATNLPWIAAEVRKVDPPKGTIVLKHAELTNLAMPPMTMEFYGEPKLLEKVKPGDKVKFQVDMVGGKATVMDIQPAKP